MNRFHVDRMPLSTKPNFDASTAPQSTEPAFAGAKVVAVKMLNDSRRFEIRLADAAGVEHVVSLPLFAAVELAQLTLNASHFMTRLKYGPAPSCASGNRSDTSTGS
jgi:hypothetical protein